MVSGQLLQLKTTPPFNSWGSVKIVHSLFFPFAQQCFKRKSTHSSFIKQYHTPQSQGVELQYSTDKTQNTPSDAVKTLMLYVLYILEWRPAGYEQSKRQSERW